MVRPIKTPSGERRPPLGIAWLNSHMEEVTFPCVYVSSGLNLVIYCANVWNERKADNVRERRDFEGDEVKSHLGLSSAQPFK